MGGAEAMRVTRKGSTATLKGFGIQIGPSIGRDRGVPEHLGKNSRAYGSQNDAKMVSKWEPKVVEDKQ